MLRIANTLFFFTKKPITVTNIRGHHGLRESHTHQVDMVVTMSNGRAEGNEEGSVEVKPSIQYMESISHIHIHSTHCGRLMQKRLLPTRRFLLSQIGK